jgi:hypothetical protein
MVFNVFVFFPTGFDHSSSTFFLDKKSGAKKSRTAQSLRVPVRASPQHSVVTANKHLLRIQFFSSTALLTILFLLRTVFFDAYRASYCRRSIPFRLL